MKKTFCLIIFCILNFSILHAQDSLRFVSATKGAASQEVFYFNNYLYVGAGSTLMVFDVSQNQTPPFNKVFEYRFRSTIMDITEHNGFLYIAANHDGISKWDISNPGNLQLLAEYIPDNTDDAAYDISFYGDSVIVAYKNKIAIFYDNGNNFGLLNDFGSVILNGIIRGGVVIDSLYLFAEGMNTANYRDGIHIYNLKDLTEISYFHQQFCDPQDIIPGKDNTVHVLGGSQSTTNPFSNYGFFYTLNISDIYNPVMIYNDTLKSFLLGIADAINGININDTIYVATMSAIDSSDFTHGYVYVYDATDISDIHLIKTINAGLWHFDVDYNRTGKKLYIASEWYGIKTIDLSDFNNYVDIGNTLTGGWNTGSDAKDSILIVANEGYGFKKYDISNIENPVLTGINQDNGFCNYVKILDNNYLVGFYTTGDGIRVFDLSSLNRVSSLSVNRNFKRIKKTGNIIIAEYNDSIAEYDFNVPDNPLIITTKTINNFSDMDINEQALLFVSHNNSLSVLDIDNNLNELSSISLGNSQSSAGAITVSKDTIWCYFKNTGLVKFLYDSVNNNIMSVDTFDLPFENPDFLTNDNYGLYAVYKTHGLYSFNKTDLYQTGYYRTGLDYWKGMFGVRDLFSVNDYVFLVEYHSQTSMLTAKNSTMIIDNKKSNNSEIIMYPNPVKNYVNLKHVNNKNVAIYNQSGQQLFCKENIKQENIRINVGNYIRGVYVIQVYDNQNLIIITKKLIIK